MEQQDWISLEEAVKLITKHCYSDQIDPGIIEKRARSKIDYAVEKGWLDKFWDGKVPYLGRQKFAQWALKEWADFINHVPFPVSVSADLQGAAADAEAGKLSRVDVTPLDRRELQDLLKQCRDELEKAKAEIKRLKQYEEKCRAEEKKEQERRKKASEAGKKGGRGNKK